MTVLQIMTARDGHKEVEFDQKVIPQEVRDLFEQALGGGAMAYRVGADPKDKEVIRDLKEVTPETQRVVVRAPMAGG